mmetsp:Transcript_20863/g.23132  ORF Transcript_20863/g.23132 Transcript_20863/m.23132 type:complete len:83 (+) Transcript_20863:57-305(+)
MLLMINQRVCCFLVVRPFIWIEPIDSINIFTEQLPYKEFNIRTILFTYIQSQNPIYSQHVTSFSSISPSFIAAGIGIRIVSH